MNEIPVDTEIVISELWDLGTTGVFESVELAGVIGAGFDCKAQTDTAINVLQQRFDLSLEHLRVEPAPPLEHWQPPGLVTKVQIAGPEQNPLTVEIDAGPSFGHGQHPTTRLALDLTASTIDGAKTLQGDNLSFLDVGTGSGILAIAAAKLGATQVVAIDNDPAALAIAANNAKTNSVLLECFTTMADVAGLHPGGFDVIAINVLLPVHAELAKTVIDNLHGRGRVVTAGYLSTQSTELLTHYHPLISTRTASIADWVGHILER